MGNSVSYLFFWKNLGAVQGRKVSVHMKKEKKKEVIPEGSSSDCFFCFYHWAKWECTHISKEHYHLMCFLVYKVTSASIILIWVLIMAGDLRYKDMWRQQWERLWRPRVHHHSSPGCWFHEIGGTSKAQICDLIKKKGKLWCKVHLVHTGRCSKIGSLCCQNSSSLLNWISTTEISDSRWWWWSCVAVVAAWPGSTVQTNPPLSARREEPREWVEAVLILCSNATHRKTSRAFTSISKQAIHLLPASPKQKAELWN